MEALNELFILFISYLLGCINGAYYLGKVVKKQDIRALGSHNAGARNAGRIFGRSAFIVTVIIDASKTIIPLLLGIYFLHTSVLFSGCIAISILLGHIWPFQLKFRGGKGVVVYLAAALALAPLTLIAVGLTVLVGLKIKNNFTIVGLIGLSTIPLTLIILMKYILTLVFLTLLLIVIIAHRKVYKYDDDHI
ncbi:glycerol-3-phosphate acyltransferase [Virgibacillus flavescens]|uniref:glycerol-3-phosphate acyltransferase n=1 Tax=Virgibacillus flavescens TaxID=1611422 RepID=UPI003D352869